MTSDNVIPGDLETMRKRLRFRSWNRGMKETDLLLGRFADKYMWTFGFKQLAYYEAILSESDPDILAWLVGRMAVPIKHDNDVFNLLLQFKLYE